MDTQNDIEACGGCQFPQLGEAEGSDCTELEGVDEVAVSWILTHQEGYQLIYTELYSAVQGRRVPSRHLHPRLQASGLRMRR